jgi:flagellar protein FliS
LTKIDKHTEDTGRLIDLRRFSSPAGNGGNNGGNAGMQPANLYAQYKAQSLETLTNGEIIVKLFEEASKQISTAIFLTSQEEDVKAYNCIAKAQKVITALALSLDMSYGVSLSLSDLYDFIHAELGKAITTKDTALMKTLLTMVDELKVTFRQAERMARAGKF